MAPEFVEIADVEPCVVDLTVHDDHPEISVRMPIYKLIDTHDEFYLELRYRPAPESGYFYAFNLSPQLLSRLVSGQTALAKLPLMMPDQMPSVPSLGMPDNVYEAVRKLRDFHIRKGYLQHFARYQK